ncbi:MAG TPA: hypothetical protein VMT19_06555 [Thermoanaerobaculaceae bacterium]|nr:hypothetical protein [Thermoanaerobaculaceae bacterium]
MTKKQRVGGARGGSASRTAQRGAAGRLAGRRAPTVRRRPAPGGPLAAGVLDLKRALDQATARFAARVTGQLGEVLHALEAEAPSRRTASAMATLIRGVKLKPDKGRLKDLARLHDLAEELVGLLPDR